MAARRIVSAQHFYNVDRLMISDIKMIHQEHDARGLIRSNLVVRDLDMTKILVI